MLTAVSGREKSTTHLVLANAGRPRHVTDRQAGGGFNWHGRTSWLVGPVPAEALGLGSVVGILRRTEELPSAFSSRARTRLCAGEGDPVGAVRG